MKRSKKIIALIIAVVLTATLFAACGKVEKHTNIIDAVGNDIVANDGKNVSVYREGKAIGDKAYEISPIYVANSYFSGFYMAKRTNNSSYELMNADGKFLLQNEGDIFKNVSLNSSDAVKVLTIEAVATIEDDEKGLPVAETKSFIAYTDYQGGAYAVLKTDGYLTQTISDGFNTMYAQNGKIFAITAGPYEEYVLKDDGTQQYRSKLGINVIPFANSDDYIIEVVSETNDAIVNGSQARSVSRVFLYDKNDSSLGDYYKVSGVSSIYYKGDYERKPSSTHTFDIKTAYFATVAGVKEITKIITNPAPYNDEMYAFEEVDDYEYKLKNINTGTYVTGIVESYNPFSDDGYNTVGYLIKEKDKTNSKAVRLDGKEIFAETKNLSVEFYSENEDEYFAIAEGAVDLQKKLYINDNGTIRVIDLADDESFEECYYENGYKAVFIKNASDEYFIIAPSANKKVEIVYEYYRCYKLIDSLILSFTIKGQSASISDRQFAILPENFDSWNGTYNSSNFFFQIDLTTEALERAINISVNTSGKKQLYYDKSDAYTSVEKLDEAFKASEVYYKKLTVTYYKSATSTTATTQEVLLYYNNPSDIKVKTFEQDKSFSIDFNVVTGSRAFFSVLDYNSGLSSLHEFYFEDGILRIRDVAKNLTNASVVLSSSGDAYIKSTVQGGRQELRDLEGNVLLPANYVIKEVYGDLVVVSVAEGSGYPLGIVKLKKNGKFDLIKRIEYSSIAVLTDGTMLLSKNSSDVYMEMCDKNGKTIESKIINFRTLSKYDDRINAMRSIMDGGAREYTERYVVTLPDGTERLQKITISEDDLNFSIFNLLR